MASKEKSKKIKDAPFKDRFDEEIKADWEKRLRKLEEIVLHNR